MPVSRIDYQNVNALANQALRTFKIVNSDRCAGSQIFRVRIFASFRIPLHHVDVTDRNKSRQFLYLRQPAKVSRLFLPLKSSQLAQALHSPPQSPEFSRVMTALIG